MDKNQTNVLYVAAAIILILVVAAVYLSNYSQVVTTTTTTITIAPTTTVLPIPNSRVLNQTEMEGIFGANGTYASFSSSNAVVINNQSVIIEEKGMQFSFSQFGNTYVDENIDFPATNYTGYNLSNTYEHSVSYYKSYLASLSSSFSSTNQSGVLQGMTYTLFTSQTKAGAVQLHLIAYANLTSISLYATGYTTSIKPVTGNFLVSSVAQSLS